MITGYDPKTGFMDFPLALRRMKMGAVVRRSKWHQTAGMSLTNGRFIMSIDGQPQVTYPADTMYPGKLPIEDILAEDWEEAYFPDGAPPNEDGYAVDAAGTFTG